MTRQHLASLNDWREAACNNSIWPSDPVPTTHHGRVTCPECREIVHLRREGMDPEWEAWRKAQQPTPREKMRRDWTVAAVAGDTDLGFEDWARGVGAPTPHQPPRINENNDGVFRFYGAHSDLGGYMEVIPMTTGNVEFEIGTEGKDGEGVIFNLSHADRANMLRALLHDFHYSPERPAHDQD